MIGKLQVEVTIVTFLDAVVSSLSNNGIKQVQKLRSMQTLVTNVTENLVLATRISRLVTSDMINFQCHFNVLTCMVLKELILFNGGGGLVGFDG